MELTTPLLLETCMSTMFLNMGSAHMSLRWSYEGDYKKDVIDFEELTRRETLHECFKYMDEELEKRFKEERDPDRHAWERLSAVTRARKKSSKILSESGKLFASIKGGIYGDEVILYTTSPYGAVHQGGRVYKTTIRQSTWMWYNLFNKKGPKFATRTIIVPQRQFLGFGEKDVEEIEHIIDKVMQRRLSING